MIEGRAGRTSFLSFSYRTASLLHVGWVRVKVCCEPFAKHLFSNLYLLRSQHPTVRV